MPPAMPTGRPLQSAGRRWRRPSWANRGAEKAARPTRDAVTWPSDARRGCSWQHDPISYRLMASGVAQAGAPRPARPYPFHRKADMLQCVRNHRAACARNKLGMHLMKEVRVPCELHWDAMPRRAGAIGAVLAALCAAAAFAADTAPAEDTSGPLQEITVTATRHEESL